MSSKLQSSKFQMHSISKLIWDSGCILIDFHHGFRLSSGAISPIYIDLRKLLSFPSQRSLVIHQAARIARDLNPQIIAGGETAGIPFAALLASELNLPMVYVRKSPRHHGTLSQIEGVLHPGSRVLLFEDVITDGSSKLKFIRALRDAGGIVDHCLVILDREQGGKQALEEIGVELMSLVKLSQVLRYGLDMGLISDREYSMLKSQLLR